MNVLLMRVGKLARPKNVLKMSIGGILPIYPKYAANPAENKEFYAFSAFRVNW